jgi:septal ring-binding cell division protein DamX
VRCGSRLRRKSRIESYYNNKMAPSNKKNSPAKGKSPSKDSSDRAALESKIDKVVRLLECDLPFIISSLADLVDSSAELRNEFTRLSAEVQAIKESMEEKSAPSLVTVSPPQLPAERNRQTFGELTYEELVKDNMTLADVCIGSSPKLGGCAWGELEQKGNDMRKLWTQWLTDMLKHPTLAQFAQCSDYRAKSLKAVLVTGLIATLLKYMRTKLHITGIVEKSVKSAVLGQLRKYHNNQARYEVHYIKGSDEESGGEGEGGDARLNTVRMRKKRKETNTKKKILKAEREEDKSKMKADGEEEEEEEVEGEDEEERKKNKSIQQQNREAQTGGSVKMNGDKKRRKKNIEGDVEYRPITSPNSIQRGKELLGLTGMTSGSKASSATKPQVSYGAPPPRQPATTTQPTTATTAKAAVPKSAAAKAAAAKMNARKDASNKAAADKAAADKPAYSSTTTATTATTAKAAVPKSAAAKAAAAKMNARKDAANKAAAAKANRTRSESSVLHALMEDSDKEESDLDEWAKDQEEHSPLIPPVVRGDSEDDSDK